MSSKIGAADNTQVQAILSQQQGFEAGWTNNILLQEDENETTYYLPAFIRIKLKDVHDVSIQDLNAQIVVTMLINIYFGDLREEIVEKLKSEIILNFGRDDAMLLEEGLQIKSNITQKMLNFVVRKEFNTKIESNVLMSPFEIIELILSITMQPLKCKIEGRKYILKFNLMDHEDEYIKIFSDLEDHVGNYGINYSGMMAAYSNHRKVSFSEHKVKTEELVKVVGESVMQSYREKIVQRAVHGGIGMSLKSAKANSFQYATFKIELYKYPLTSIIKIFLPLWLLSVLNIFLFFSSNALNARLGTIANLLLAFVALIPTVRQALPPSPSITLIEILVYSTILTSFLCLIDSFLIRNQDSATYQMDVSTDGYYIASIIISILTLVIVTILLLIHKCVWEPRYLNNISQQLPFNRKNWKNLDCDQHFLEYPHIHVVKEEKKPLNKINAEQFN